MPQRVPRNSFDALAEDPDRWLDNAVVLKAAAEEIGEIRLRAAQAFTSGNASYEDIQQLMYGPVFLMLAGLAIEVLLKATVVRREQPTNEGLPQGMMVHDIVRLTERCHIPLSDTETAFARRLEKFVRWAGRYPAPTAAPTDASDLQVGEQTDYGDLREFRALFGKLEREYHRVT